MNGLPWPWRIFMACLEPILPQAAVFCPQAELNLKTLPLGSSSQSRLSCTLKLYVLRTFGKKSKRNLGELHVRIWLTNDASSGGATLPGVLPANSAFDSVDGDAASASMGHNQQGGLDPQVSLQQAGGATVITTGSKMLPCVTHSAMGKNFGSVNVLRCTL